MYQVLRHYGQQAFRDPRVSKSLLLLKRQGKHLLFQCGWVAFALETPRLFFAAACVSSFVSKSALAIQFREPMFLLALSSIEPSCRHLCLPLRNAATVGLRLPASVLHNELFDCCAEQDDFRVSFLDDTLGLRDRKLPELFSGAHAGRWLTCPTPQYWSST